jgi:hypothetical protein
VGREYNTDLVVGCERKMAAHVRPHSDLGGWHWVPQEKEGRRNLTWKRKDY